MKHWLSKYRFSIYIAFVFIVSRLLYNAAGVHYDVNMYDWAWQLLEVDVLKHKLLEGIWYMHSQPPLFNLFCGIILKISGPYFREVFHLAFLCIGLLSALLLYDTMRRLGIRQTIAFILTTIYVCSPSVILYENWLFYTYLEPFILLIVIWGATCYFKNGQQSKYLWITFLGISAACLTRSVFHISFFVLLILLFSIASTNKRKVLAVSLVPFLLTFSWYLKNLVLFGAFSASSWFGMNFARMTYNDTTPIGKIGLWQNPDLYREFVPFPESPYDVQALTQKQKQSGAFNYNYYGYIAISDKFKQEALDLLKKNPKKYRETVAYAITIFFEPADQVRNHFLEKNRQKIPSVNRIYNFGYESPTGFIHKAQISIIQWMYILILLGAIAIAFNRRKDNTIPKIVGLISCICLYIFMVGVMFEVIENNRFRFSTISLFFILAGIIIQHLVEIRTRLKNKNLNKQ